MSQLRKWSQEEISIIESVATIFDVVVEGYSSQYRIIKWCVKVLKSRNFDRTWKSVESKLRSLGWFQK